MSYYTGSANNYSDVLTALVSACTANGWTWADSILSKGGAFVRPYVSTTTTNTEGPGLLIEGGTGKSGSAITGASACVPRMGRPGTSTKFVADSWPATYHIFAFENPDEVFVILNFNIDCHYFLAFGVSDVPGIGGTGLWVSGTARRGYGTVSEGTTIQGFIMSAADGGTIGSSNSAYSSGFLWNSSRSTDASLNRDAIHFGGSWAGAANGTASGAFNAIFPAVPHIGRLPNAWNNESPLIPIQGHVWAASSKCSLAVDVRNARYVRLDNYEPGQIVTLGSDRWKVFPFYKRNVASRDAGNYIDHTGTFGWAIRYDGP